MLVRSDCWAAGIAAAFLHWRLPSAHVSTLQLAAENICLQRTEKDRKREREREKRERERKTERQKDRERERERERGHLC